MDKPLSGIRVIEMGQLIASPFVGCMLGYFGAEIIKIEPPGTGDPLRQWRALDDDGTSFWWRSLARNKKSVTINLRESRGRELARALINQADVVVENFRPGTLEKWGLGPKVLTADNAGLIVARISGYGQTGPYASRPGFASVCEGIAGFRYINGFPGEAPVRPNLSMGDTLAGLHTIIGVLLGLIQRGKAGQGQVVDTAIYESIFNILESVVPEYDGAGIVREPSGTTLTGIVPTNTYRCIDGKYVIIGGNGDSIFRRLMHAAGRDDLGEDPRFADNVGRVKHQQAIDNAILEWTQTLTSKELLDILEQADVPAGPIYSVEDMMTDPHFQARALFEEIKVGERNLKIPALIPKLSDTPGATEWPGPELGAHNDEVFKNLLKLDDGELKALAEAGVI